jgi:hypothetical protein
MLSFIYRILYWSITILFDTTMIIAIMELDHIYDNFEMTFIIIGVYSIFKYFTIILLNLASDMIILSYT